VVLLAARAKNDISIITRTPGNSIGAGPFFQRTAILVMTNAIQVLESRPTSFFCRGVTATPIFFLHADDRERQTIKDTDGNMPRRNIRACSISDPFVLIIRAVVSPTRVTTHALNSCQRRKQRPMGARDAHHGGTCYYQLFYRQFFISCP
jgi:cleavage and polyadenylation specificity factor subunit 1